MLRAVTSLAMLVTLVVGTVAFAAHASADHRVSPDIPLFEVHGTAIPDCHHEDGSGQEVCAWIGSEHGNGQGETYLVVNGESYIYVE